MKKIYLASPFFNQEERQNVQKVAKLLRDRGFDVYVPMEHEIKNGLELPNNTWANQVFIDDVTAIRNCDYVVAITYGMKDDAGTAWEIGFAYGIKKPVFTIPVNKTTYSLMVYQSIVGCFTLDYEPLCQQEILQS
jgi:nucleoside 2-deoxyribosyltransferase